MFDDLAPVIGDAELMKALLDRKSVSNRKGGNLMKKIIISAAFTAAACVMAVGLYVANSNKPTIADKPEPPTELPSGNYYIGGDPANNDLYLVVDGKTIHFESSGDLREAFQAIDKTMDPLYLTDKDALDHQTDITMADWGDDSYTYALNYFPTTDIIMVYFRYALREDGLPGSGQALKYYERENKISGWAGDFVLAETE